MSFVNQGLFEIALLCLQVLLICWLVPVVLVRLKRAKRIFRRKDTK